MTKWSDAVFRRLHAFPRQICMRRESRRRARSGPLARAQISLGPLLIAPDKMLMARVTKAAACIKNENPQSNYYIQY